MLREAFLLVILKCIYNVDAVKLLILEETNSSLWEGGASGTDITWEEEKVTLDRDDPEGSFQKVCESLESGVWLVLDMTWSGWHQVAQVPGVPYLRADLAIAPLVSAVDLALTKVRNATDAALIYQHETHLEQSLWFLIRDSTLRVAVFPGLETEDCDRLKSMRPSPSAYVIFADSTGMNNILQTAVDKKLVMLNDRWVLVYLDMGSDSLNRSLVQKRMMLVTMSDRTCCSPSSSINTSQCVCPQPFNLQKEAVGQLRILLQKSIDRSIALGLASTSPIVECTDSSLANLTNVDTQQEILYDQLTKALEDSSLLEILGNRVKLRLELQMRTIGGRVDLPLARWNSTLGLRPASFIPQVKRFFRIGTGFSIPFAYPSKEMDAEGEPRCEGYVIDLIDRLAEMMNFDYELVLNADFGVKLKNGTWTGLIGLLATGRVDMIVASLTMTSEREEVIDFVAPYFEQTGFSIVIRKKVKRTSLFKFMTVLRVEVWLSILGALCLTAIMIWFLDKYSPYSARNNKGRYPYPCRDFSLRESFWFAVTSFTPQGGGEAPKSLSARTLVAAYWLFVVLMLATFTANLAAFLTVERMQSPVQSLKHLAKQSRINYTVVKNSDAHEYFKNMKNAEEVLYTKWKELTLNSSSDQSQFRVWDYPIKEQYGQIYYAIEKAGPVNNLTEGLRKVIESEEAEFALIGDYKKLKYYVYQNCNLTMIGEPFAEQPYAIAVQQGSHLNEEVSRRILDLQRERFFEAATDKYWNSTAKGKCDNTDDNEGITLESLGGVFIATLFGLLLALLTLGMELWYHKKKSRIQVVANQQLKIQRILKEDILKKELGLGVSTGKASLLNPKPKISYITVYPRGQLY